MSVDRRGNAVHVVESKGPGATQPQGRFFFSPKVHGFAVTLRYTSYTSPNAAWVPGMRPMIEASGHPSGTMEPFGERASAIW